MNKRVSVVITTYKRPITLERAIKSVLNQTYDNIEIIVVDDNDEESEYRKIASFSMRSSLPNKIGWQMPSALASTAAFSMVGWMPSAKTTRCGSDRKSVV